MPYWWEDLEKKDMFAVKHGATMYRCTTCLAFKHGIHGLKLGASWIPHKITRYLNNTRNISATRVCLSKTIKGLEACRNSIKCVSFLDLYSLSKNARVFCLLQLTVFWWLNDLLSVFQVDHLSFSTFKFPRSSNNTPRYLSVSEKKVAHAMMSRKRKRVRSCKNAAADWIY